MAAEAGLDVVVSLLESQEAAQLELAQEADAAGANSVDFVSFPIPDRGVPSSTRQAVALLGKIARKLDEGKNVAVHCRQGVGRSGLIAAGVLVTSGMSVDQAIEAVSAARGQSVPETADQLQWIHHLPPERLVGAR